MNSEDTQEVDLDLIDRAKDLLTVEYTHNKHHVAVALRAGIEIYTSLHMDSRGFDVCAEPVAIHNALQNKEGFFHQIVAITLRDDGEFEIISPCGNCRQILLDYTPDIGVILDCEGELKIFKPIELLPRPYLG